MEQRLLFVFHLDSLSGTTFTNAANSAANGTAVNLNNGRLETGKLGIGVELNNNNQVITFVNPIASSGPSTFSAWVSQQPTNDNELADPARRWQRQPRELLLHPLQQQQPRLRALPERLDDRHQQ